MIMKFYALGDGVEMVYQIDCKAVDAFVQVKRKSSNAGVLESHFVVRTIDEAFNMKELNK
jgi:hypothetical protein